MIIAIDGPAASGKSTTASLVAEQLGFTYLDTGAMYRAVTLVLAEHNLDPDQAPGLKHFLSGLDLSVETRSGKTLILLEGVDISDRLRSGAVTARVSAVSALPVVREAMVALQRRIARHRDCVVEGRDIGTVVFPEADFKFFIVAAVETRARRRQRDLRLLGEERELAEIMEDLRNRDRQDSSREHSPLRKAADAIEIDTSHLTISEQVTLIVEQVKTRLKQGKKPND